MLVYLSYRHNDLKRSFTPVNRNLENLCIKVQRYFLSLAASRLTLLSGVAVHNIHEGGGQTNAILYVPEKLVFIYHSSLIKWLKDSITRT